MRSRHWDEREMAHHLPKVCWKSVSLASTIYLCHFIMKCLEYVYLYDEIDSIIPSSWQSVPLIYVVERAFTTRDSSNLEMLFKRRITLRREGELEIFFQSPETCTMILLELATYPLMSLSLLEHEVNEAGQLDLLLSSFYISLLLGWLVLP